jgi:hypothetical protein
MAKDPKTGLPVDYDSLFREYHRLVLAIAHQQKIPLDYYEDVAANLEMKFWEKDGLNWFDPSRGTKFGSMYRSWLNLAMLHEKDMLFKDLKKYTSIDTVDLPEESAEDENVQALETRDALFRWHLSLVERIEEAERYDLLPTLDVVLKLVSSDYDVTIRALSEEMGLSKYYTGIKLKELREFITQEGYDQLLRGNYGDTIEGGEGW